MQLAVPITKKQRQVLETIRTFVNANGYSPSVRQLGQRLGLAPATIQQHLDALQTKRYIGRTGTAYGVTIKRESAAPAGASSIPVIGAIAAGEPILAVEDLEDHIAVPQSMAGSGEYFALRVQGDSMVDDHILDGDVVLVRRQDTAENGDVVVALLEDGSATLKRLFKESSRFRLQPANSEMRPIFVRTLTIQGKVTGIVRQRI